jgi:hypothetical protein
MCNVHPVEDSKTAGPLRDHLPDSTGPLGVAGLSRSTRVHDIATGMRILILRRSPSFKIVTALLFRRPTSHTLP